MNKQKIKKQLEIKVNLEKNHFLPPADMGLEEDEEEEEVKSYKKVPKTITEEEEDRQGSII